MATEPEAKPQAMPWEETYQEKPNQPVAAPVATMMQKAQEAVSDGVEAIKNGKMPWDMSWKEKPVVRPSKASKPEAADVRKADITSFLNQTIGVESGGNPNAKNPESSATGLGQFIDSTWKEQVALSGKNYTLEDRKDPAKAREILADFTKRNLTKAQADLGRTPTNPELYLYHFLGSNGAPGFIKASGTDPATDHVTTTAARSNRTIFYKSGKPRTVDEVKELLGKKFR